jgi:hypothetical protein
MQFPKVVNFQYLTKRRWVLVYSSASTATAPIGLRFDASSSWILACFRPTALTPVIALPAMWVLRSIKKYIEAEK